MTIIDTDLASRRSGDGWAAWVGPTTITLIVTDQDEEAGNRAITDLSFWTNPESWVCEESGWLEDGSSFFVFTFEPTPVEVPPEATCA